MIFAVALAVALWSAAAQAADGTPRQGISGADLRIFTAALEGYRLDLVEDDAVYVVSFSDPNRPEGVRGTSPNMPEFAMQLRKDDLSFIRWVGVR